MRRDFSGWTPLFLVTIVLASCSVRPVDRGAMTQPELPHSGEQRAEHIVPDERMLVRNEMIKWTQTPAGRFTWEAQSEKATAYFRMLDKSDAKWLSQLILHRGRGLCALALLYEITQHPAGNPLEDDTLVVPGAIVLHIPADTENAKGRGIYPEFKNDNVRYALHSQWRWFASNILDDE